MAIRNARRKTVLLSTLHLVIFGFLFFVGSITFYDPAILRGQTGLVIPLDSLVYEGRLGSFTVTQGTNAFTVNTQGQVLVHLALNEQKVLSGSMVELTAPLFGFTDRLVETSQGTYAVLLSEQIVFTPQVSGMTLEGLLDWKIQPVEYSVGVGSQRNSQAVNVPAAALADYERGLQTGVAGLLAQAPIVGYVADAQLANASTNPQTYTLPLSLRLTARLLDANGAPLANQTLTARMELPGRGYAETLTILTDETGTFTYSRRESVILQVSGGQLATLARPLVIERTSFVVAQQWWAPPPPPSEPPAPTPQDQQNNGDPTDPNTQAGQDPINLTTGNMFSTAQDLFLAARGLPIRFTRTYNSKSEYQGPLGFAWTHSYNAHLTDKGTTVEELDGDGTLVIFTRQPDGTYASPAGNHDQLTKHPAGTYTLRQKHGTAYRFNAQGKLTSITDRNGNQITLGYSGGNLVTVTDASGRVVKLDYDSHGWIVRLTDPLGRITTYGYDETNSNLTSVTDPLGHTTDYEYKNFTHQHQLLTLAGPERHTEGQDPQRSHATVAYDDEGRAISFTQDGNNHKITLSYDPTNQKTTVTDSKGNGTTYHYQIISDIRLVTRIADPHNQTQEFAWDADLNRIRSTDQNGHTTTMAYDSRGNQTSVTDPLNSTTRFAYEPTYNLVTQVTDPLGHQTTYEYDGGGNLTAVTDPLGNVTRYAYDAQGQLSSVTDAEGHTTRYEYDEHGNLATVIDPLLHRTDFAYDLVGNTTGITDAKGRATTFLYDALNRLTRITYPDLTHVRYTYDEVGNRTSITDPKANATRYGYDVVNRLAAVQDPLGNTTRYSYDTEGNRIRLTDANRNPTTYHYDSLNRLIETINPLGERTRFRYDAAGNRTATIDANGNTLLYTYDSANRLTRINYPDSSAVSFAYDAVGRRTSMTDSRGVTTYTYDALGRLTRSEDPGLRNTITYAYDRVGNRVRMTDQDGGVTTYTYDALSRLQNLTNPSGETTPYAYDEVSNLTQMAYPNGAQATYTFDHLNRLITLVNAGSEGIVSSHGYEYDAAGMRTKVTLENGEVIEYTYDAANRLTSEIRRKREPSSRRIFAAHYTYDAAGNRLTMSRFLQKPAFSDDGGENDEGHPDVFELPGKSHFTYRYDKDNRLQSVEIRRGPEPREDDAGPEETDEAGETEEAEPDDLLVKFKPGTSKQTIAAIHEKFRAVEIGKIPRIEVQCVRLPAGVTPQAMAKLYRQEIAVQYAEPNYTVHALKVPNDPDFAKQWGLHNTGQTGGTADADIDVPEAWDLQTGNRGIVLAIVDTGCDLDHPDLQGKFIAGHDFVNSDSDPQDDNGHGTYTAGIAAAMTDNTVGVAGVLWENLILPVKVLGSDGSGTYEQVSSGIIYATDNGADVINLSLGGSAPSKTLEDAMRYAHDAGVVVVSAVGNDGGPVLFPAAYTQFGIAVAATSHHDQRAIFSNVGPAVDVGAPGVNIYSTWWNDTYRTASGTSASTPFVAGLAGLLLAQDPTLSPDEVESRITSTAEDVNASTLPGTDPQLGAGRINAYQALSVPPPVVLEPVQATITYAYDANGNQISQTVTRGEGNGKGNVVTTTYTYDFENRLTAVTSLRGGPPSLSLGTGSRTDEAISSFTYDGLGKRVAMTEAGRTTQFLYDGLNVILERNPAGATQASYTRGLSYGGGIGSIVSGLIPEEPDGDERVPVFYHYDGIGAVTGLTDEEGEPEQAYTYDAFGNLLAVEEDEPLNPYRFSTKEFSPASGFIYFGARYYDPRIGRFLTPDPLGMIDGPNRYLYVGNNPVNWIDPWGLTRGDSWWGWDYLFGVFVIVAIVEPTPVGEGVLIAGFTRHGINRVITRSISPRAILDAVKNPTMVLRKVDKFGRVSYQYVGRWATVVLNKARQVVTAWWN